MLNPLLALKHLEYLDIDSCELSWVSVNAIQSWKSKFPQLGTLLTERNIILPPPSPDPLQEAANADNADNDDDENDINNNNNDLENFRQQFERFQQRRREQTARRRRAERGQHRPQRIRTNFAANN